MTDDITPPWDVFNEILERAQFKYKAEYVESTQEENPQRVKLIDKQNGKEVFFENLSSGETTIMALIFALYNSSNKGHFPQVILFDEPDAHLHPSLTQVFLDVILDVLVEQHNVKVILTTHSPSTVALAPDESVYCMDRGLGRPVKEDKRTAINILSSGLVSLTIEESNLGINYNIHNAGINVLFTEGITDKINLEIAWEKLYPGRKRNFYIQDSFSASFLGNLFTQGDQAPDGIFHQFDDLKMIALFDFDAAGYAQWNNKKKFPEIVEINPRKGLTRFNRKNGYLLLLPVPNIEEITKQVIVSENDTYEEKSYLTIESLLFDDIAVKGFFKTVPLPGGGLLIFLMIIKVKRNFQTY
ncbi:AAA family ATPase [Mucilaginibacter sp. P19]|uniref:AAA family ATPase n=1 Tax=Mucilaginibacter sp. P19 TaxID=3423947 RepID=UPI003D6641B2